MLVRPLDLAPRRGHDHVVGIDAVALVQHLAKHTPPVGLLPPRQRRFERFTGRGQRRQVKQTQLAEVQHDLGHAAGKKYLHGGVADGSVGQCIDEARRAAVHVFPIVNRGPSHPGGERDCRDVQQQVGRAAERGVNDHGIVKGRVGKNVADADAALVEAHQRCAERRAMSSQIG